MIVLRHALRALRRSPGYAASAGLSLALAVALNTSIFSFVEAVLLRPAPYAEPGRLYGFQDYRRSPQRELVSPGEYAAVAAMARGFSGLAAYRAGLAERLALHADDAPSLNGFEVSANLFQVLGVKPVLGRGLEETEPGSRSVMISYAMWQRRFGGRRDAVGSTQRIGRQPYVVVGVMPAGFWFPSEGSAFWVPLEPGVGGAADYTLSMVGRLRAGVSEAQMRAEARVLVARLNSERADPELRRGASLEAFDMVRRPSDASFFYLLQGVVLCVVLITCANVSKLTLVRALSRRHETAIRAALGASRTQLVLPLLVEGGTMAVAATVLGTVVAMAVLRVIVATSPLGALDNLQLGVLNVRGVVFGVASALVLVLLCNMAPLFHVARVSVAAVLKDGAPRAGGRAAGQRGGNLVAGAQMAVSLILLVNLVALVSGISRLLLWRPQVNVRNLYVVPLRVPGAGPVTNTDSADASAVRLVDALRAVPGVLAIATSERLGVGAVTVDGAVGLQAECVCLAVTPDYLRTAGVRIVHGRDFAAGDAAGANPVIVDELLAHRLWGTANPLGRRVRLGSSPAAPSGEVVGVAAHVELSPPPMEGDVVVPGGLYVAREVSGPGASVLVRGTPGAILLPALRRALDGAGEGQLAFQLRTVESALATYLDPLRWYVAVLVALTGLALCLAAIGLYGVVAYGASQRLGELAVRAALGARPADLLVLVSRGALGVVVTGAVVGLLGGTAANRVLAAAVPGVASAGLPVFAVATGFFTFVIAAATLIPAARASRVSPASVLKSA